MIIPLFLLLAQSPLYPDLAMRMSNATQGVTGKSAYIETKVSFLAKDGGSMVVEEYYFDGKTAKPGMTERKLIPLTALVGVTVMKGKQVHQARHYFLAIRYRQGADNLYRFESADGGNQSLAAFRIGVYTREDAEAIRDALENIKGKQHD